MLHIIFFLHCESNLVTSLLISTVLHSSCMVVLVPCSCPQWANVCFIISDVSVPGAAVLSAARINFCFFFHSFFFCCRGCKIVSSVLPSDFNFIVRKYTLRNIYTRTHHTMSKYMWKVFLDLQNFRICVCM